MILKGRVRSESICRKLEVALVENNTRDTPSGWLGHVKQRPMSTLA